MIKNKKHIWFFIFGIATANLTLGLAIYYGIATWVSKLLFKAIEIYPWYVYGAALSAGILCLLLGIHLIIKTKLNTKNKDEEESRNFRCNAGCGRHAVRRRGLRRKGTQ